MKIHRNKQNEEKSMAVNPEELMTVEEEARLIKQIQNGEGDVEGAKAKLLKANQRFVRSVAKQYITKRHPIDELIVEGNKGLESAIYRYVENHGFKFISYAVWFIRRHIEEFLLEQLRLNRISLDMLSKRKRDIFDMAVSPEELMTVEEEAHLVKQIQNGEGDVEGAKAKLIKANQRFVRSVAKQYATKSHPIDELIVEGKKGLESAIHKYVENHGFKFISYATWFIRRHIEEFLLEQLRLNSISLDRLSKRQRDIFEIAYGIGRKKADFDEICKKYELTRERALYIKRTAFRKLFLKEGEE